MACLTVKHAISPAMLNTDCSTDRIEKSITIGMLFLIANVMENAGRGVRSGSKSLMGGAGRAGLSAKGCQFG
jgi:hypothetical protein